MSADRRGWRMALVPDVLLNPPPRARARFPDVLRVLEDSGYGVLQLPPPGRHALLLAVIADQVAEYAHHGYAVVAIGMRGRSGDGLHWRPLAALLSRRGTALPPRCLIGNGDPDGEALRLTAFLAAHDLPVEEQRRWRV